MYYLLKFLQALQNFSDNLIINIHLGSPDRFLEITGGFVIIFFALLLYMLYWFYLKGQKSIKIHYDQDYYLEDAECYLLVNKLEPTNHQYGGANAPKNVLVFWKTDLQSKNKMSDMIYIIENEAMLFYDKQNNIITQGEIDTIYLCRVDKYATTLKEC